MKKIIIITGGNRGLGEAIIDLALKGDDVLIVSLSRSLSDRHKNISDKKLIFIETDLLEPFSSSFFKQINQYITNETTLYFFNNAATILPIDSIGTFKNNEIENSILINVQYPAKLINFILANYIENKIIFINITSGAATTPIANWSLYGASKAFMQSYFKVLNEENKKNGNFTIFQFDPGVMDTGMQNDIRKKDFPEKEYFVSLKMQDKLGNPEDIAQRLIEEINYQL